jgi:hypothetical protein
MRTFPVGRCNGVNDDRLPRPVEAMQMGHCGIEREKTIERQRWCRALELERIVAAQPDPVGISDGRDGGQAIEPMSPVRFCQIGERPR